MRIRRLSTLVIACICFLIASGTAPPASAWGDEGHRWVNRVAAESLPQEMPEFFRKSAARLEFLGPEPDRWRDNRELFKALGEVNSPDHFINIDRPEDFMALPNDRYRYADWLRARSKQAHTVGFLPYSILEGYQRVQVMFRLWRGSRSPEMREQLEQNIIHYAGVLGHYVADGAQPLHTTIHYNGWATSANPGLYTREPLHWRFEGEYVRARITPDDFRGAVKTATKLDDVFASTIGFLLDSYAQVEPLYRMEKAARWDPGNQSVESKRFVAARLAAGAQMLANLWYTAWLDSSYGAQEPR